MSFLHSYIHLNKSFDPEIVFLSSSIGFNMFLGAQKNCSMRRFFWVPTTNVLVEK